MNILNKVLMIACSSQLIFSCKLESCTRIFWNDNAQAKIVARTMDLFISDEPQIWINPRGIHHQSKIDSNGLKWASVYGSVSISAFHKKDFITDGLNEKGFAVHALALRATQYEQRNDRPGIHYGEWLQYLLDTCQTVEEALIAHNNFQVVPIDLNGFVWPLHLMMEDSTGDSAIIEFVEGQLNIHHSFYYQVGTNDPPYNEHLKNLSNYEGFGGTEFLPTKKDSMSRFVLASAYLKQLPEPKNVDEAILLTQDVIRHVFQKDNIINNIGLDLVGNELKVTTLWTVISDLTHRTFHFIPNNKTKSIHLDLSELNFSENGTIEIKQ